MPTRRLALNRDKLAVLQPDELVTVTGGVSVPNVLCVLSIHPEACYSGSPGCTAQCPPPHTDPYC